MEDGFLIISGDECDPLALPLAWLPPKPSGYEDETPDDDDEDEAVEDDDDDIEDDEDDDDDIEDDEDEVEFSDWPGEAFRPRGLEGFMLLLAQLGPHLTSPLIVLDEYILTDGEHTCDHCTAYRVDPGTDRVQEIDFACGCRAIKELVESQALAAVN